MAPLVRSAFVLAAQVEKRLKPILGAVLVE
jgi:hypothetical protein